MDDGTASKTVVVRIQRGRIVAYALITAGLYGLNGLSSEASINMVTIYIIPAIIIHGIETLRQSIIHYGVLVGFIKSSPGIYSIYHSHSPLPSTR